MSMRMQMVIITTFVCLAIALLPTPYGNGFTLTHVSTGDSAVTITFNGIGEDTSTTIQIEKMAQVDSASFKVEGGAQSGIYPTDVVIDVNDDGDAEWAFEGEGYGSLGHQNVFADGEAGWVYLFNSPGSMTDASFSLPKSATINSATMAVTGGGSGVTIWDDDFSTDKGWSGYGGSAEWERAPAVSGGGDPGSDHTPTTDNYIIGNDIGDNYQNSIPQSWLTSPVIDCSSFTNVFFEFYRVLNIESSSFDHAKVDVYNGVTWVNVFDHTGTTLLETSWSLQSYDVSAYADNNANFRVRFALGPTDFSVVYGGWNIDDVRIYGDSSNIMNPSVDIGNNGNIDWAHVGVLSSTVVIPDFSSVLSSLLQGPVTYNDPYGNQFVNISVKGSVGAPGAFTMSSLNIQYSWQGSVDVKPGGNLVTEINAAIPPTGDDNQSIPISVASETAGKVTLSNFQISYDARPKIQTIPDLMVYEDTPNPQLLDLGNHITDDTASLAELDIQVTTNTMAQYIGITMSTDHQFLEFTPLVENWNSVTSGGDIGYVELTVTDSQSRLRVSNLFAVDVQAVNDEPLVNILMKEFSMVEDEDADLFLEAKEYFTDYEYDILYYAIEVDPLDVFEGEALTLKYSSSEKKVTLIPGEDFNTHESDPVPLWVYCDDDPDVDTLEDGTYVYQEVSIYIDPVNDPPVWSTIDPIMITEDEPQMDIIDLTEYVLDIDTPDDSLEYELISNDQHQSVVVVIDEDNNLDVTSLREHWTGTAEIEVEVRDEEDDLRTTFSIVVTPVNDAPSVQVTSPSTGAALSGTVAIKGQSSDPEKTSVTTEFCLDGGQWTPVDEDGPIWTYNWDTLTVENGEHTFLFRGSDGELFSEEVEVKFQVENIINEPPTVTISGPAGGSNVSGVVSITGTAFDTDVVASVSLQIDGGPWLNTTGSPLLWSFQWNTTMVANGQHTIAVRAYDGELFSPIVLRTLIVDNTADEEPPTVVGGDDDDKGDDGGLGIWLWIIIILVIVVVVVILVLASTRKKEEEPDESHGAEHVRTSSTSGAASPELRIAQPASPGQAAATQPQYGAQYQSQPPAQTSQAGYGGYQQYGTGAPQTTQYPPGVYGQPTTYQAGQYQMAASPYAAAAQQTQTQSYQMTQGQPVVGYLPAGQTPTQQGSYQTQQTTYQPRQTAYQGQGYKSGYQYQ